MPFIIQAILGIVGIIVSIWAVVQVVKFLVGIFGKIKQKKMKVEENQDA